MGPRHDQVPQSRDQAALKLKRKEIGRKGAPAAKPAGAFDVHVFLASGAATKASGADWRAGERYSLLIFSRQPIGERANLKLASEGAAAAGWKDVKLERSKRLPSGASPADATLQEAFGDALSIGCSVVAHRRSTARDQYVPAKSKGTVS
jgi:hypothetical protein